MELAQDHAQRQTLVFAILGLQCQFISHFNNLCLLYSEVQNMCIGCATGTASGAGGCVHEVALS